MNQQRSSVSRPIARVVVRDMAHLAYSSGRSSPSRTEMRTARRLVKRYLDVVETVLPPTKREPQPRPHTNGRHYTTAGGAPWLAVFRLECQRDRFVPAIDRDRSRLRLRERVPVRVCGDRVLAVLEFERRLTIVVNFFRFLLVRAKEEGVLCDLDGRILDRSAVLVLDGHCKRVRPIAIVGAV